MRRTLAALVLDQSSPDSRIDDVLSADLGAAYGAQLDSAVLTGSGSGQMTGLLNMSGVSTVAAASSVAGMVDGVVTGYQQMVQPVTANPMFALCIRGAGCPVSQMALT